MFRRIINAVSAAAVLVLLSFGNVHAQSDEPQSVPGEFLVAFRTNAAQASKTLQSMGFANSGYQSTLGAHLVRYNTCREGSFAMDALQTRNDVLYVEPNYIRHVSVTPNDPAISYQYDLRLIEMNSAWELSKPKANIIVAVVDTGVDYDHVDLKAMFARDSYGNVLGYNALKGNTNARDDYGHGTHVAGTIAAQTNNGIGVASIAGWSSTQYGIKIMPVKVMDSTGSGPDSAVADGIVWAANHGAKVINLSLGSSGASKTLNNAVQYAWTKGCVVVAAAGNEATSTPCYPAACANVISVGATDDNDRLESYSNYGSWVKVAAPGYAIMSTANGGGYKYMSGTSCACPHVAGEAALICASTPNLTNSQVSELIIGSVDSYKLGSGNHGIKANGGRINIRKGLAASNSALIASVSVTPSTVTGGASTVGAVALTGLAGRGGAAITLASSSTAVSTPGSVTVAEGAAGAQFSIRTIALGSDISAQITATLNGTTKTTSILVLAPRTVKLSVSPTAIMGGKQLYGSATLNLPAPVGGYTTNLSSSDSAVSVPATVTIPAGKLSVAFVVNTKVVTKRVTATITATGSSARSTTVLDVLAPAVTALRLDRSSVKGGSSYKGVVSLNVPAPTGGLMVTMKSSSANVIPDKVLIPAGYTMWYIAGVTKRPSTAFDVATLTASYGDSTAKATLTIQR